MGNWLLDNLVAFLALGLGVVSLGWHIKRDRRERGGLRVSFADLIRAEPGIYELTLNVTNYSANTISIHSAGWNVSGSPDPRLTRDVKARRTEGTSKYDFLLRTLPTPIKAAETVKLFMTFIHPSHMADSLAVWDSTGRVYLLPEDELDTLKKHIESEDSDEGWSPSGG